MPSSREPTSVPSPAISLRGISKRYAIWEMPSARLLAPIRKLLGMENSTGATHFTAVNNVSLDVWPGECLGIIGRNGAGKSTLLQIIAGTLNPSEGEVRVNGRVAALLELGSGFNPDFTGRENIHLNAAILGLSRDEIAQKFDAIVEYSGIGEFLDQPVRTYSSGMAVRLAFAVCVHVDADILIIDEALAVGDARFQFKCHATLEQMQRENRTIIFVSHDTNSVKRMCRTAVLLERGEILHKGDPNEVTNLYTKLISTPLGIESIRADLAVLPRTNAATDTPTPVAISPEPSPAEVPQLVAEERAHRQISDREYSYGGDQGRITDVEVLDESGRSRLSFVTGSRIRVRIRCEAVDAIPDPIYAITLKDVRGQEIYGTNTYFLSQPPQAMPAGGIAEVIFDLSLNVLPGVYFFSVGWVRLLNGDVSVIHRRYDVLRFDVLPTDKSFGIAYCPTKITVQSVSPRPAHL